MSHSATTVVETHSVCETELYTSPTLLLNFSWNQSLKKFCQCLEILESLKSVY